MMTFKPGVNAMLQRRILDGLYRTYQNLLEARKRRLFNRKQFNRIKMDIQRNMAKIIRSQDSCDKKVLTERLDLLLNKYGNAMTKHMRKNLVEEFMLFMGAALLADALINYVPSDYSKNIEIEYPETSTEFIG